MDVRPGRDAALSRLFEAHYPDTVRLAGRAGHMLELTGGWVLEPAGPHL